MSKIIKSVRVRSSPINTYPNLKQDIRVDLIQVDSDNFIVEWKPTNSLKKIYNWRISQIEQSEIDKFSVNVINSWNSNSDAEFNFIKGFNPANSTPYDVLINKAIMDMEGENGELYEIVQDPWREYSPNFRNYGYDYYYLNNGSQIKISWFIKKTINGEETLTRTGGYFWSDESGNELNVPRNGEKLKGQIIKNVVIYPPDGVSSIDKSGIEPTNSEFRPYGKFKPYKYRGKDISIIENLIKNWNSIVNNRGNNYSLSLCKNSFTPCNEIPYISPLNQLSNTSNSTNNANVNNANDINANGNTQSSKIKLKVNIPSNVIFIANNDIIGLNITLDE